MDVIVIGGGASGLTAAIGAARSEASVTVIEANAKPAEKILATGGGRCNFTNINIDTTNYYEDEANKSFIEPILYNFDAADAINFFESVGVYSVSRSGYIYPRSEEASTIRDALLNECDRLGVKLRNNTRITKIEKHEEVIGDEGASDSLPTIKHYFEVFTEDYSYKADNIILATGGRSGAKADSEGIGYELAKSLGHKINLQSPALTGLALDDELTKASGTRTQASISVTLAGTTYEASGEIQLTSYGISGIPVMNISRHISRALAMEKPCYITIDFLPEISMESLVKMLQQGVTLEGLLPKKLAKACSLKAGDEHPKSYKALIKGVRDFEYSQVTRGGVDISEVEPTTMQSKLTSGLYFAGELLDIDGMCGGYNLHFAWATGMIAGCAAAGTHYRHRMPSIEQLRRWEAAELGSRRESNE